MEPQEAGVSLMGVKRNAAVAFVLAAVTSCGGAGASTGSSPSGGVSGRVLSAPSCPVERAGTPCLPRPVHGATVTAYRGKQQVASTKTDRSGTFRLSLAGGHYLVVARNSGALGTTASKAVDVTANHVSTLTLTVDSGIR